MPSPDKRLIKRLRAALDDWEASGGGPTDSLTGGGAIQALEGAMAQRIGVRHALALSSGTMALRTALLALGVKGGEVVCPALDWPAAAAAILSLGARPVPADVSPQSILVDPAAVASRIGPRTAAVMVTHPAGVPAPVESIRDVCRAAGVPLIEDASQALGASIGGRSVGGWGDAAILSLGFGKTVDACEAGILVTNDRGVYLEAVRLTQHPTRQLLTGVHPPSPLGLASRIHPVAGVLALHEMRSLEEKLDRQRTEAAAVLGRAAGIFGVHLLAESDGRGCSWWSVPALVETPAAGRLIAVGVEPSSLGTYYLPPLLGSDDGKTPRAREIQPSVSRLSLLDPSEEPHGSRS